jgi:hypothetical protein
MTDYSSMFRVDLTEFTAAAKRHLKRDWPKAVVNALSDVAMDARDEARDMTKGKFDLHSDWVPKGIMHTPNSSSQKAAAANALQKYGDFTAAVFLRGATDPKKSLGFMAHHEYGEERDPVGKFIAIPLKGIKGKSFRASKGSVKKKWRPSELLKRFNETGSKFDGRTTIHHGGRGLGHNRKGGKLPGNAFIIGTKSGPMIARRARKGKKRTLEFLYVLKTKARIKELWGFVGNVYDTVGAKASARLVKAVKQLPVKM